MQSARPELLGIINKTQIINLLRASGPISKADIARELGASFPTVSTNTKSLLQSNILLECGASDNELGRKGRLLKYNSTLGYVLGGDIGRNSIHILLADLSGAAIGETEIALPNGKCTSASLDELDANIDQMLQKAEVSANQVLDTCIGIPYRVDSDFRDRYLNNPAEHEGKTRLDQYFSLKFKTCVHLENSINLGALGEKNFGAGRGYSNVLYINYGVGIGSALLLDGKLFTGRNGAAGEISYCITDTNDRRVSYSDVGLLEELIATEARKIGLECDENMHIPHMKPAFDRAIAGDSDAKAFLNKLVSYFGVLLVNAISLINPEVVIFSGGVGTHLLERYYSDLLRILSVHVPYMPQLVPSMLREKGTCLGAVSVALDHLHSDFTILEKALLRAQ